jgi:hypothetical protein
MAATEPLMDLARMPGTLPAMNRAADLPLALREDIDHAKVAVEIVGAPDPANAALAEALRRETYRYWDRYVEPLIEAHWPQVRQTPFYPKFKIGALEVYAPAPYTVAVISRRRPRALRAFNSLCRLLRLPRTAVVTGVKMLLPRFTSWALRRENPRIVRMGAFIALADEAFDHHLGHVPIDERPAILRAVLERREAGPNPAFRLLRAIVDSLYEGTDEAEAEELRLALDGAARWGEAEARRARGEPDPDGLAHRKVGILTGIDGLAWTVRRHISQGEHDWMYAVSEFIQILDDWVDALKDHREGTWTPVHDGRWDADTIREHYAHTTKMVGQVVRANGERYDAVVELAKDAYRYQVQDLLQHMVSGVAE